MKTKQSIKRTPVFISCVTQFRACISLFWEFEKCTNEDSCLWCGLTNNGSHGDFEDSVSAVRVMHCCRGVVEEMLNCPRETQGVIMRCREVVVL